MLGLTAGLKLPERLGLTVGLKLPERLGLTVGLKLPERLGLTVSIKLPERLGLTVGLKQPGLWPKGCKDPPPGCLPVHHINIKKASCFQAVRVTAHCCLTPVNQLNKN